MDAFLRQVKKRDCPVIPVLLPGTAGMPELPVFLEEMGWVDFSVQEPAPLEQLIRAITYKKQKALLNKIFDYIGRFLFRLLVRRRNHMTYSLQKIIRWIWNNM